MSSNNLSFKRHKYRVAPKQDRVFLGRTWDSKAEKMYAERLMLLKKAGNVIDFAIQPLVILQGDVIYRPDFLVIEKDDAYYVDVKGVITERFRVIQKLWPETQNLRLKVVKRRGQSFTELDSVTA